MALSLPALSTVATHAAPAHVATSAATATAAAAASSSTAAAVCGRRSRGGASHASYAAYAVTGLRLEYRLRRIADLAAAQAHAGENVTVSLNDSCNIFPILMFPTLHSNPPVERIRDMDHW